MAQFNVHEAKTNFSQLLEMMARGEEIIIARNGKPIARLVGMEPRKSILGIGRDDPNYIGAGLSDEEICSPLSADDLQLWSGETD